MIESDIHPHVASERAELFEAVDSQATESEYLHLLTSLVKVLKPRRVLETGTYNGHGTAVLARACRDNGLGFVDSVEADPGRAYKADLHIIASGLRPWARIHAAQSVEWIGRGGQTFDFGFFDSDLPYRVSELRACLDTGLMGRDGYAVFHDTSRARITRAGVPDPRTEAFWRDFDALSREFGFKQVFEFPLSRGMTVVHL